MTIILRQPHTEEVRQPARYEPQIQAKLSNFRIEAEVVVSRIKMRQRLAIRIGRPFQKGHADAGDAQ